MEEPDLEVGSDEDGELDAYNMDPGKCTWHQKTWKSSS